MFIELGNTTKKVLPTFEEGIAKIQEKLMSHSGFLSYLQDSTANLAHLSALSSPILVCPLKAIVGTKFLA
jgi:hypothetical protein